MGTDELTRSVVEFKLEHSKTGFSRYLNMAAVTATSGLRVADAVMAYCRAAEFKMVTSTVQAGVRVITPDFWVVRVSLLGLDERGLIKLMNAPQGQVTFGRKALGRDEGRGPAAVGRDGQREPARRRSTSTSRRATRRTRASTSWQRA